MAFPLFDLPAEAVDLVLGSVDDLEDKRALRLVCKRSRASVDSRVVAVNKCAPSAQLSALVQAPWQLQRLDLSARYLGPACAASLEAAPWPALQVLKLDNNCVRDAGAASLAAAPWPALRELSLRGSIHERMGPLGAASLAAAPWTALQVLHLDYNNLGDAGASSLATAPWTALRELSLARNSVGDAGAASLAAAPWPALKTLSLHYNNVGDAGAASLAAAPWTALRTLRLPSKISSAGRASLQAHWPAAQLQFYN